MQFSNETLTVLKNFSTINPSIAFKPGKVLSTISPTKTILARADIAEEIESSAAVYDLNRFLATLSLLDEPDVSFGDKRFDISKNRKVVHYTYTSEEMIVTPPSKELKMPSSEIEFDVSWEELESVIRAAGVLQLPDIEFSTDGNTISISAVTAKNPTSDRYDIEIDSDNATTPDDPMKMFIKQENLKLLPRDYHVSLSSRGMAHFKSSDIEYFIALDAGGNK